MVLEYLLYNSSTIHLLYTGGLGGSMSKVAGYTSLSPIQRVFTPGFVNYKKGAFDSQPQVIKFSNCLPMVGGSLRLPPPLKLVAMTIAEILLKVALKHQKSNQSNHLLYNSSTFCTTGYTFIVQF